MNILKIKMLWHKFRFVTIIDGCKRADYLKKHKILCEIGDNCMFQSRNFPMNPELVKIHNNVSIAANVTFVCHDAIRHVLGGIDNKNYVPHLGPIEICDNVFIGIGSIIMPNVHIGKNSIIAAGSLVTKDVLQGSIVGGVPAKIIGNFGELHQQRIIESESYKDFTKIQLVENTWKYFNEKRK